MGPQRWGPIFRYRPGPAVRSSVTRPLKSLHLLWSAGAHPSPPSPPPSRPQQMGHPRRRGHHHAHHYYHHHHHHRCPRRIALPAAAVALLFFAVLLLSVSLLSAPPLEDRHGLASSISRRSLRGPTVLPSPCLDLVSSVLPDLIVVCPLSRVATQVNSSGGEREASDTGEVFNVPVRSQCVYMLLYSCFMF